jgi:hypothetical protein
MTSIINQKSYQDVLSSLHNVNNSSNSFIDECKDIAEAISTHLNCDTLFEEWGNYCCSNKIILYMNDSLLCKKLSPQKNLIINILISAKGPFYTFVIYKQNDKEWSILSPEFYPDSITFIKDEIEKIMQPRQLRLIQDEILLAQITQDCYTEIDMEPATIFEVIFGEII